MTHSCVNLPSLKRLWYLLKRGVDIEKPYRASSVSTAAASVTAIPDRWTNIRMLHPHDRLWNQCPYFYVFPSDENEYRGGHEKESQTTFGKYPVGTIFWLYDVDSPLHQSSMLTGHQCY